MTNKIPELVLRFGLFDTTYPESHTFYEPGHYWFERNARSVTKYSMSLYENYKRHSFPCVCAKYKDANGKPVYEPMVIFCSRLGNNKIYTSGNELISKASKYANIDEFMEDGFNDLQTVLMYPHYGYADATDYNIPFLNLSFYSKNLDEENATMISAVASTLASISRPSLGGHFGIIPITSLGVVGFVGKELALITAFTASLDRETAIIINRSRNLLGKFLDDIGAWRKKKVAS